MLLAVSQLLLTFSMNTLTPIINTRSRYSILKFIQTSLRSGKCAWIRHVILVLFPIVTDAGPAFAHGFAFRYDLPLPLHLYLGAAGAVVFFSFFVIAYAFRFNTPLKSHNFSLYPFLPRRSFRDALRVILASLSITLFTLIIIAGLFGNQSPIKNLAPVTVWVIWWVGFVYLAALLVNMWPLFNPWDAIFRAFERVTRKKFKSFTYPKTLGYWPALVLFLIFAWSELVWPKGEHPRTLAIMILGYSMFCFIGMAVYGRQSWLKKAEVFSVTFSVFGRFAPIHIGNETTAPYLRYYGVGLLPQRPTSLSLTIFILTLLATVSFDGFMETPIWSTLKGIVLSTASLAPILLFMKATFGDLELVIETTGLIAAPLVFTLIYLGICWTMSKLYKSSKNVNPEMGSPLLLARWLVFSLVPIAIAYHLAHYLSYLLIAGQLFIPLISDPLGLGWNLFNTAGWQINIGVINAKTIWHISIFVIVVGHIISVYLSHRTSLRLFGRERKVVIVHAPMVALMVMYTSLSLWILAQPIVDN